MTRVIGRRSYLLITPITSQPCHAKSQNSINRRRTLPAFSRWWITAAAWPERLSESQDAVALQQIAERGAMIDREDIRQAIDRCSNIWASLPGAGYGQSEHGALTA